MFHDIPQTMLARMQYLEEIDGQPSVARDREDGTPRLQRLRQVPGFAAKHETGKFIALLAASAPDGAALEIGTSAGYSTLWIALGRQERGCGVTTFEILPEKVILARETFRLAGVADMVELVEGDARDYLSTYHDIAFCFLDSEKELYAPCYEAVIPRMAAGGFFLADNALSHQEELQPVLDRALEDPRVDATIVPVGKGVLVCRKI